MTYLRRVVGNPTTNATLRRHSVPSGTSLTITTKYYPLDDDSLTVSIVRILQSVVPGKGKPPIHYAVTKNNVRVVLSKNPAGGWIAEFGLDDEACFELGFSDLPGSAVPDEVGLLTIQSVAYYDGSSGVPLHFERVVYA